MPKWPTIDFYFTEFIKGATTISIRIWTIGSIVVVDYISTVHKTGYINGIWHGSSCKVGILETQNSILFDSCIRYENRKSEKSFSVKVPVICLEIHKISVITIQKSRKKGILMCLITYTYTLHYAITVSNCFNVST